MLHVAFVYMEHFWVFYFLIQIQISSANFDRTREFFRSYNCLTDQPR